MRVLAIGDVTGPIGCNFLKSKLPELKEKEKVDVTIVNGENSAQGNGISTMSADFIFESGADIITTGNHVFRKREIQQYLNEHKNIIRPANYPNKSTPGSGMCRYVVGTRVIYVINLLGTVFMEDLECPAYTMNRILNSIEDSNVILVDFHAEATAEKKTLGLYLDGRVSALFGTHTHVLTADECILPKGTGYITDIGMTGPIYSSLGIDPKITIRRMLTKMPVKFEFAMGACHMDGAVFDIDEVSGKTVSVKRISVC